MKPNIAGTQRLVDEQIAKWQALNAKQKRKTAKPRPVITLSREPGTAGTRIAQKLAKALDMDFMSGQIIQEVAQSAQINEKVVASLDERRICLREDWLKILFDSQHLWPDSYLLHLTRVMTTIGQHGNAVVLGRGANFLLPPQETFRIRLIAPKAARIERVMADRGVSKDEADKYVTRTESDRKAFIMKYFHVDVANPAHYDLVIDASRMGVEGTVQVIKGAYEVWTGR